MPLKFVCGIEGLYGLRACTFNVHQLTHLSQGVRNCGPLWATSAFLFEANNHNLLKMFQGTRFVPQQITETFLLSRRLQTVASHYYSEDASPAVCNMFSKLCNTHVKQKNTRVLLSASSVNFTTGISSDAVNQY